MGKLNKRQMIILAVAGLFIFYAIYILFVAKPGTKKGKAIAQQAEFNSFVNSVSNDLMKNGVAGIDAFIVKRAEADWKRNPFLERPVYREWVAKESAAAGSGSAVKIIYSGYVDSGRNKMAIINGLEYRAGEQLEMEGYMLKNITPSKVLIVNRNTGSEITVPIQE